MKKLLAYVIDHPILIFSKIYVDCYIMYNMLFKRDKFNGLRLFCRILLNDVEAVEKLLLEYKRNNRVMDLLTTYCTDKGYFPIHLICKRNNVNIFNLIKKYLTHEELIELLNLKVAQYGLTPLFIATERGNSEIFLVIKDCLTKEEFKNLINSHIIEIREEKRTLLQYACEIGNVHILRAMIDSLLREGNDAKSKQDREKVINMVLERRDDGELEITHAFRNYIRIENHRRKVPL